MSDDRVPQVFVHPISPFALRALYGLAFKNVSAEITEVDLICPSPEFLAASETRKVPALTVFRDGQRFHLIESMFILEYIDTAYSGPSLYPRTLSGDVDTVKKARIDADCRNYIEAIIPALASVCYGSAGEKEKTDSRAAIRKLNDVFLQDGQYFSHAVCGENVMTIADIALLPMIQYVDALKETLMAEVVTGDLTNLWTWFARMSAQPWVQRIYPGNSAISNYLRKKREGVIPVLTLPVSTYF